MSQSGRALRHRKEDGCGLSEQRGGPVPDFVPPADWADVTRVFNEHRNLLIGVAYRVLGHVE